MGISSSGAREHSRGVRVSGCVWGRPRARGAPLSLLSPRGGLSPAFLPAITASSSSSSSPQAAAPRFVPASPPRHESLSERPVGPGGRSSLGLGLSRGPDARSPVRVHSAFRGVRPAAPPTRSEPSPLKRRGALGSAPCLRRPPQTPPRGAPPPRRLSPGADWLPREPARPPIGRENDGEGAGPEAAAIPVTRLPASGMLVAASGARVASSDSIEGFQTPFTSLFPRAERRSGMFRPLGE